MDLHSLKISKSRLGSVIVSWVNAFIILTSLSLSLITHHSYTTIIYFPPSLPAHPSPLLSPRAQNVYHLSPQPRESLFHFLSSFPSREKKRKEKKRIFKARSFLNGASCLFTLSFPFLLVLSLPVVLGHGNAGMLDLAFFSLGLLGLM